MLPSLSALAKVSPTGADDAPPAGASEAMNLVVDDPDLLSIILSAVNVGKAEEACALAVRWCAARKGPPCDDDALWSRLLMRVFPYTVGREPPRAHMWHRVWFYHLCTLLSEHLNAVKAARAYMEFAQSMTDRNLIRHFKREKQNDLLGAPLSLHIAELELKVVRWGRWRPYVRYTPRQGMWLYPRVLTDNEMRAELDRLDAEDGPHACYQVGPPVAPEATDDDDGADGPMHGDSGRR